MHIGRQQGGPREIQASKAFIPTKVQTKVAEEQARRLGVKYYEVSAKENINIEHIFH